MPSDNKRIYFSVRRRIIKRLTDVLLSLAAIIILSPLILYVAVRVLFSSKGPVLYSQERVGYRGKTFLIRKFRSMYSDAETDGPQLSASNDPRITSWGRTMRRWKVDELPQLWNVLIGEMSLVGPRPERPFYVSQLEKLTHSYSALLEVKPGVTSLGMVKFGYAGSLEEMIMRMKYDLIYLEKNSLLTDLKILGATIRMISKAKGR